MEVSAKTAIPVLMDAIRANQPVMIWGPPGIGKSAAIGAVTKAMKMELRDLRLSQLDPTDIKGLPTPNADRTATIWLPPSFLPGPKTRTAGVLFLDELSSAPPLVQVAAYQLVLDRKVGDYELPAKWVPMAAGNRAGDRSVASALPSALASRFAQIDMVPNVDHWCEWAIESRFDPLIIAFQKFRPASHYTFDPKTNPRAYACPRTWAAVNNFLALPGGLTTSKRVLIEGSIGEGVGTEFFAFATMAAELPTVDEVLKAPDKARMPEKPDARYAIMTALALQVTMNTFAAAMTYVMRCTQVEYQTLFLRMVLLRGIAIHTSPAFSKWVAAHGEILTG